MISHVVLYKTNPDNPTAQEMIVDNAQMWLESLGEEFYRSFHVARIAPRSRAVNSGYFDVMLNITFENRQQLDAYMQHPYHLEFVKFVLHGWMLEGSTAADLEAEFIDYVLNAGPNDAAAKWVRNPAIPESEVVWACEEVCDTIDE